MVQRNVDLAGMLEIAHVGVRRASAFLAIGLRAAGDRSIRSVRLDASAQTQFMPNPLSEELSHEVRANFAHWIIGNGLRELSQHLVAFIDEIFPAVLTFRTDGKVPPNWEELCKPMRQDTNLGSKLLRLQAHDLKASWSQHLSSLSFARNALTHNLGFVRKRDCNCGDELIVTWPALELVVDGKAFSHNDLPVKVEKGQMAEMHWNEQKRTFKIGDRVEFTAHDLNEICLIFQLQANEIHNNVVELAKRCGAVILDKDKKPAA